MEPVARRRQPTAFAGRSVLLIEDDEILAGELAAELGEAGLSTTHTADGAAGAKCAAAGGFDLLIVDRMLPGLDGLAVIAALRAAGIVTPVLIISALSDIDERVRGLKGGGDDYLIKPFALAELMARVEALLRRPTFGRQTTLSGGGLTLDLIDRTVHRDGVVIELLPREFKLLEFLMRHAGQVVTRAMLLEEVWNYRFIPETNLIDVHIGRLRRKIDRDGMASLIQSVRGQGFIFRDDA